MTRNANGLRGIIGLALGTLITMAVSVQVAHAGTWMQVSCVNPDGSAAPSQGWAPSTSGPSDPAGIVNTLCSPSTPMVAELSATGGVAAPPNSTELLTYQPPAGSALVGGSVDVDMSADGFGNANGGSAVAASQLFEPSLSTPFFRCVAFFQTCGSSPDFSGVVNLPDDAEGNLTAAVNCSSSTGTSCDQNAKNNAWALMQVRWAHLLLSIGVSPSGSGFSGSALQPGVRGTGHLLFTAGETAGPGIYSDAVAIDGRTVSTATPNANGGNCVPVGTDPGTGALMFDTQQPCLTSETLDVPVPTQGLPDGRHDLAVTVTDAAGNSSTVYDNTITTSNPQTTPAPKGRRALHARFVISWHWKGAQTLLRSIRVTHLLHSARVTVRCAGRHCPRVRASATGPRRVATLLRRLGGHRLRAGQTLLITVTARGHAAERIAITVRNGHKPSARLLR